MRPTYWLAVALTAAFVAPAFAQSPRVVMEEMMVPAEAGIEVTDTADGPQWALLDGYTK